MAAYWWCFWFAHCTEKFLDIHVLALQMKEEYSLSLADLKNLIKHDPKNAAAKKEIVLVEKYIKEVSIVFKGVNVRCLQTHIMKEWNEITLYFSGHS